MAKPAHTSLFQLGEHAGASSSFHDSVVWDLVLSGDFQNALEAAHVKCIELLLLSSTQCPGLIAIQEGAHDAGSVDLDLCVLSQHAVVPCFLCQSGHGGSCLADAPVQLCVK